VEQVYRRSTGSDAIAALKPAVRMSTEPRINLFMRGLLSRLPGLRSTGLKQIDPIPLACSGAVHQGKIGAFLLKLAVPRG